MHSVPTEHSKTISPFLRHEIMVHWTDLCAVQVLDLGERIPLCATFLIWADKVSHITMIIIWMLLQRKCITHGNPAVSKIDWDMTSVTYLLIDGLEMQQRIRNISPSFVYEAKLSDYFQVYVKIWRTYLNDRYTIPWSTSSVKHGHSYINRPWFVCLLDLFSSSIVILVTYFSHWILNLNDDQRSKPTTQ